MLSEILLYVVNIEWPYSHGAVKLDLIMQQRLGGRSDIYFKARAMFN